MIPKIIHYCWISGEENMPEDIKQCISSWHKHLPDYQFINWNDSNFDWNICEFTKHCRENNLYAFCSDYIRFWSLYNYGGIYLDADVLVNKSFDELLNLNRIITSEIAYIKNNYLEAALMGFHKGDEILKECLDYYHTNPKFTKTEYIVSPDIFTKVCKKYDVKYLNNLTDYDKSKLNIISCNKYFNLDSEECFAQHLFKGSWCSSNYESILPKNYQIFLCAHKPIDNYIPNNKHYTIIDVSGTVKDAARNIIDISQDEFTKTHNICYGEGCAMRYLWKHPEIVPEYICFGHYRRMFLDFVNGNEMFITRSVDNNGAIIKTPFKHINNKATMYRDHLKDDIDVFIQVVNNVASEYSNAFQEFLNDTNQYACNIFAMRKEHFFEMCEMCFKVLDEFDKRQGYKNNMDVMRKMIKNSHTIHLKYGINWQRRLQGFLLEYLTDTYYRYKFGVDNCRKSKAGIPELNKSAISLTNKAVICPFKQQIKVSYDMETLCDYTGIHNLFVNPKDNFMFSIICKNACSYLKYVALQNNGFNTEGIYDYHTTFIEHGLAYHPIGKNYNIEPKGESAAFNPDDYKMVYVWRDPFERFVSLYNDKVKLKLWFAYKDVGLTEDTTFEEFLDFAEYNIKNSVSYIEEHIRPQIDYYTTKVDYVVPIDKLGKFMEEFNISNDRSYINSFPHDIEQYEQYRDRIYKLYSRDLDILDIYKDKIYK